MQNIFSFENLLLRDLASTVPGTEGATRLPGSLTMTMVMMLIMVTMVTMVTMVIMVTMTTMVTMVTMNNLMIIKTKEAAQCS